MPQVLKEHKERIREPKGHQEMVLKELKVLRGRHLLHQVQQEHKVLKVLLVHKEL